jgi:hypothetical protein
LCRNDACCAKCICRGTNYLLERILTCLHGGKIFAYITSFGIWERLMLRDGFGFYAILSDPLLGYERLTELRLRSRPLPQHCCV